MPVQATARIAAVEEVEGIRAQEDVDYKHEDSKDVEYSMDVDDNYKKKFVATLDDVREAYDTVHTLRYSQPAHLQGKFYALLFLAV